MRRRQLDHRSDRPLYRQVADDLREQIHDGELAPGDVLPGLPALAGVYATSRETVRKGLMIVEGEGLVTRDRGFSYEVAQPKPLVTVELKPGEVLTGRAATIEDRDHGVPEGAQVFVVTSKAGVRVYLVARTEIRYPD